ncbi:MAG: hypothetical protein Q7J16_12125 [Candidatus Cloacimonadales bacterium]|nr:hypothetical protein [Candidatus Cloacimonadales bacterium]
MKRLFLLFLLFLSPFFLNSIDLNLPVSAMQNATSGLNLIFPTPASAATNPAICISGFESTGTQLFSLAELPFYNVHFAYRFGSFGLHLGDAYLDHEFYQENHVSLSGCFRWQEISVGLALRMLHNEVTGYHDASATLFDAGMFWQNGAFSTAIAVHNIMQSSFLETELPVFILWESCYELSEKSRISLGWEKENDFDFACKFAGRYDLFNLLTILTSYQFGPDRIGVGTVFHLQGINVTYSVRTHQYIGLTHYISVGYEFGK